MCTHDWERPVRAPERGRIDARSRARCADSDALAGAWTTSRNVMRDEMDARASAAHAGILGSITAEEPVIGFGR